MSKTASIVNLSPVKIARVFWLSRFRFCQVVPGVAIGHELTLWSRRGSRVAYCSSRQWGCEVEL